MLLSLLFAGGCTCLRPEALDSFVDKHYVLEEKDARRLDGPYTVKEVVAGNAILVERENGEEIRVTFRGCRLTGDPAIDSQAEKGIGTLWPGEVYLLKETTIWTGSNQARGVVYQPANRVWIGRDSKGKFLYRNLSYRMPQLVQLAYGELALDPVDKDFRLHEVFVRAEELAKQHRKGYWATGKN